MHIVANLSEDSGFVRVSRTSNETSLWPHGKIEITGHGHVPHYCVDADKQDIPSPSSQTSTEPALAASTTSSAMCTHAPRLPMMMRMPEVEVVASTLFLYT